jgi:hypothetical protein
LVFKDGTPVIEDKYIISKHDIEKITMHALSLPYEGHMHPGTHEMVFDSRFEGMLNAEVIEHQLVAAAVAGDLTAVRDIKDRLLGKPKQQVESTSIRLGYDDYLMELAKRQDVNQQHQQPLRSNTPGQSDAVFYDSDILDIELTT